MVDRSGQQLGHYKLIRFIGRGGSADVYLARNMNLRSLCAIKILRTPLMHKGQRKFLEEARLAATLEHDHIVRVLDFDVQNGVPFIVMSYAPHGSLRNYYPRGTKLSFSTILTNLEQIADALDYLHAQNLIHLDIKSENLLLGRNYEVLLGDFGITEATRKPSGPVSRPGTLYYMSPEHLRGKPCTASDQYALAICVYEWLTGQFPFEGTRAEIRWQHVHDHQAHYALSCLIFHHGKSGATGTGEKSATTLSQRGGICGRFQRGHAACSATCHSALSRAGQLVGVAQMDHKLPQVAAYPPVATPLAGVLSILISIHLYIRYMRTGHHKGCRYFIRVVLCRPGAVLRGAGTG